MKTTKTSPLSIRVTDEERALLTSFASAQIIPTSEAAVAHYALTLGVKILQEQMASKPLVQLKSERSQKLCLK